MGPGTLLRCAALFWVVLWARAAPKLLQEKIAKFGGACFEYAVRSHWWSFDYCVQGTVLQYHKDFDSQQTTDSHFVGTFSHKTESGGTVTEHYGGGETCEFPDGKTVRRSAEVVWRCCGTRHRDQQTTFVESVIERRPCQYELRICSQALCNPADIVVVAQEEEDGVSGSVSKEEAPPSKEHTYIAKRGGAAKHPAPPSPPPPPPSPPTTRRPQQTAAISKIVKETQAKPEPLTVSEDERLEMLQRVREMFFTAYDGYMRFAFPAGELRPITCRPGNFDLIKIDAVTLIDTLDTLAIMGNGTEFARAVREVIRHVDFDVDVNVSVFETTIRLLGGLLSAHLFAIDPELQLMPAGSYKGELLGLARDLGDRLLPAFDTRTGIPFGTVNLKYGVPRGESEVASTAGAGTLTMEFFVLSQLTDDWTYFEAADEAVRALYSRRSDVGLVGKHIHIQSGKWTEHLSGIGSNADSFYEYLLKMYFMMDDDSYWTMFASTYLPVRSVLQQGDWFVDVDMMSGKTRRQRFENLQSFWPGMEVLIGNLVPAKQFLNAFYAVWNDFGFVPEEFDFAQWQLINGGSSAMYPLRPELIESTYYMYQATKDESWLRAGVHFLTSIDMDLETACGFATVKNIGTTELADNMPSFFLSETLKYLYLLFDTDNFIHSRPFIFSTEAHPFDLTHVNRLNRAIRQQQAPASSTFPVQNKSKSPESQKQHSFGVVSASWTDQPLTTRLLADDFIPRYCPLLPWFHSFQYDPQARPTHRRNTATELFNDGPTTCSNESQLLIPASDEKFDPIPDSPSSVVALDVPGLGRFLVDMSDGVKVTHTNTGEVVELHNLGYDFVVVRNSVGVDSRLVMATMSGNMITCAITPSFPQPPPRSADMRTFPEEFLKERYCSVAAFGPTATAEDIAPFSGEVVLPDDRSGCEQPKRSWWGGTSPLRNKLVMVKRGQCMFEEKARNAETAGSIGVVVTNTDDELFVMAGMKETEETVNLPSLKIPTVMVTSTDGKLLEGFLELARRRKLVPQFTVRVSQYPGPLANEIMGLDDGPMVYVQQNMVHIQPKGSWSLWLTSSDETDWRITISAQQGGLLQPEASNFFTGLSAGGQGMTIASRGTTNLIKLYSYFGRQVCPAAFEVHASNHISLR